MTSGVIYLMTSAVRGLVKIGKTETQRYELRMRELENNGYFNVAGLRRLFAIEVEDYSAKERMLHELFEKARLDSSELFAINKDLAVELLSSFEGTVIYPKTKPKGIIFDEASEKVDHSITVKEKQKHYGVTFEALISAGFLNMDEPATMLDRKYPGGGIIKQNGIEVDGEVYTASKAAHKHQVKVKPEINSPNGWEMWGVKRGGSLKSLKAIRDEYLDTKG